MAFKSSRSDRSGVKQQSVDDYLDEDELEERKRTHLHVKVGGGEERRGGEREALVCPGGGRGICVACVAFSLYSARPLILMHILASLPAHGEYKHILVHPPALQNDYDTFGSSAAEMALSAARRDAESRPSIIPGGVLEELVVPVANSIGEGVGGGCGGGRPSIGEGLEGAGVSQTGGRGTTSQHLPPPLPPTSPLPHFRHASPPAHGLAAGARHRYRDSHQGMRGCGQQVGHGVGCEPGQHTTVRAAAQGVEGFAPPL